MALNRYGNRRDENEPDIFETLRDFGFSVHSLDTPADCIVGYAGRTYLVEIKNGPKATLTPPQVKFSDAWRGDYIVLRSVQESEEWAREIRRKGRQ